MGLCLDSYSAIDNQKRSQHALSQCKNANLTHSAIGGAAADAERVTAVRYEPGGLAFTSSLAILLACVLNSVTPSGADAESVAMDASRGPRLHKLSRSLVSAT